MLRKYLFYAMFLISPIQLEAQQDMQGPSQGKLTFSESLKIGLENSRSLKKAYLDEESARFQRNEIRGAGLPQLNGYGQYRNFINVFPQALPGEFFGGTPGSIDVVAFGVPQSIQAGAQLNQLIFSNSYLVGLKAARTGEEFYKLLSQQTEEDVIYDISLNYFSTVQMELQRENLLANIDQLEGLEKILHAQYKNELGRKVDLNRVKVNLTSLESELENLDINIERSKGYLNLLMGIPVDTPISLNLEIGEKDNDLPGFQLEDLDLGRRKDLQILSVQQQLYNYELKNIRATNQPQLVGFADFNTNSFGNSFDWFSQSKSWYQGFLVGLKLDIPIFDGFVNRSKAAQSKVKARQLEYDIAMAEESANLDYHSATSKYFNSIHTLNALHENLKLAKEVMEETELLYKEGISPLTDVLEAESTLRAAQSNYNNQIIQVRIAQLEILKSTGNIKNLINL
ncbi:TolC family protein [Belliella sp. DSM 111904]|uniref:TolC family protein n=1 Tax=Belliella filtrata TaxID=2923435 RepID=A0ABS9UWG1_9BACT|nr:TolC family protein [Belliella filtrata]MCH7408511.1 TolC family protein [Belliella filtrata]